MRRPLTDTEWAQELQAFDRTAFRFETQPAYSISMEEQTLERYLAGDRRPPTEAPGIRAWLDQIASLVATGRNVERVRVHDEPPTPYQRFERWVGRWNTEAGEQLRYVTRREAVEVGLPATGTVDWWLMDSERLIVMRFDDVGHLVESELVTDLEQVAQACTWRDLAVHHSTPDSVVRGGHA